MTRPSRTPSRVTRRPAAWRRRLLLGGWVAAATLLSARAAQVQVIQGQAWRDVADGQQTTHKVVAAPRGTILDRDGLPLAVSRETYRVGIAPNELTDAAATADVLEEVLGLAPRDAARLTAPGRRWAQAPGRFPPQIRARLAAERGVYLEREMRRFHPHGDLAGGILGVVQEGNGLGGIEQSLDEVLRGSEGREVVARDNVGSPIPGENFVVEAPRTGGDVLLTVDMDLQEIARQALAEAIDESDARGGDVLVTDPHTGEILAMVSIRDGKTAGLAAINTPYEPGSTLKPFTVAGLLENRVGSLADTVDVGEGVWNVEGRTLRDVHSSGKMTVGDALRVSSNVGIAKAAAALSVGEQYENLRDFGFGVPTGVPLPGEVGGTLRRPERWSAQSPASLAIGYEISVTPLQMAMAYGALANGGVLMEPRLVREVRDARGRTVERFEPRAVRRVVGQGVTRDLGRVLEDVVADGTGTRAQLSTFRVAGKSGTSRAYSPDGGYARGEYFASFVGFFPAEDPQLVVVVKLENPRGSYYGGAVAAPVTRATMVAALAARSTHLDRDRLLRSAQMRNPGTGEGAPVRFASRAAPERDRADRSAPLPPPPPGGSVDMPDVSGLTLREAAQRLHALGLRVSASSTGRVTGSRPGHGAVVESGDTVRLTVRPGPVGG